MSEKQYLDSFNFEALAGGIYETATNVEDGRDALVKAYNSYEWSDPVEAKKILEDYGSFIQFKHKDQSDYTDDIPKIAPISIESIPAEGKNPDEFFNQFEEENLAYLNSPDVDPMYAVRKTQLIEGVKNFSSAKRREWNSMVSKATKGEMGAAISDLAVRAIRGAATGVEPYVNAAINSIPGIDNFELNDYLTEYTDPKKDSDFVAQFAEAAGSVGGVITAGALGGPIGVGLYAGTQAGDPTYTRYEDTLRKSGDPEQAKKAATIEGASQALQLFSEVILFGNPASKMVGKKAIKLAGGLGEKVAGKVIPAIGMEAFTEGTGQIISNRAENVETNRPLEEDQFRGAPRSALIGGMLAGGVSATIPVVHSKRTIPGSANSNERGEEIKAQGYPVTPITKQVVGDNRPPSVDVIPAAVESTKKRASEEDVTDFELAKVKITGTPAFETEDGTVYNKTNENQYTKERHDPIGVTPFATTEQMGTILTEQSKGNQVTIKDGEVVIEKKDPVEGLVTEKIALSREPQLGLYPVEVGLRSPDKMSLERPISFGQKIKNVYPIDMKSGGAASFADPAMRGTKESTVSKDVRNSDLTKRVKSVAPIPYVVQPWNFTDTASFLEVDGKGVDGALESLRNGETPLSIRLAVANGIYNTLRQAVIDANATRDWKGKRAAEDKFKQEMPFLSEVATGLGQGLQSGNVVKRKGILAEESNKQGREAYETAVNTAAKEEGVTPEEVKTAEAALDTTQKLITHQEEIVQTREKLEKPADAQAEDTIPESEDLKKDKQKLEALKKNKEKLERLAAKEKLAQEAELDVGAEQNERLAKIEAIDALLNSPGLTKEETQLLEAERAVLTGVNQTNPTIREAAFRWWIANLIGQPVGIAVGQVAGLLDPVGALIKFTYPTVKALIKNIASGTLTKYRYPMLDYLSGLTSNKDAYARGFNSAKAALMYGDRVKNAIAREDIVNNLGILAANKDNAVTRMDDWLDYVKAIKYKKEGLFAVPLNVGITGVKIFGGITGGFLRVLMATEAMTYALHDSGYDRAAAAVYYNKAKGENVSAAELMKYKYSPTENWEKAQVAAKSRVSAMREAGLEVRPSKEGLIATELYQGMRPKEVQVSAFKQAASVGLNLPAPGYIGIGVDLINYVLSGMDGRSAYGNLKFLTPFANSIGVLMGRAVDMSPLAAFGLIGNEVANRTYMERQMMISSSITTTAGMAAIALYALKQLDLPEEERAFDIIGMYSSSKGKRDAFLNGGGKLFSVRVGDVYIPFGETPFVLSLGGVASVVDRTRDGKDPEIENGMIMSLAGTMFVNTAKGIGNISMLRGVTDILSGINQAANGTQGADITVARAIANTAKGFVGPIGLLRTIARYTDNPVDAKRDFASALVEGFPGLQSAYGKEALNIFGEPLGAQDQYEGMTLHRLFSTRSSDRDIRWLVANNYSIPNISNLAYHQDIKDYLAQNKGDAAVKLNYELKYKVYTESAQEIRSIVAAYRARFENSANNEAVQRALTKDVNSILQKHIYRNVR